jgi:2-desacetyl-2-hydroxyethyl bacteriochlorophyllide A dehydrogenase
MKRLAVYFTAPRQVEVREETVPAPAANQVVVQTLVSAISSGTEMLFYRGQAPTDIPVDETLAALAGDMRFPLKYGYSAVGHVAETGADVSPDWQGRLVFGFNPHESHFIAALADLIPVPTALLPEEAAFLPNMETAVNLLMDGQPLIGEQVAVFGQGVVGLLTTALLAQFPLARLVALDPYALRREKAVQVGAHASLDPADRLRLQELLENGADLVYELSGNPAALDQAIVTAGFNSRVIVGSWYGQKPAALNLGGRFHRSRIRLISSQVSRIAPEWTGRWNKARRFQTVWQMIERIRPAHLVTHRIPVERAAEAYALLEAHPEQAIQVNLNYGT